MNREQWLTTLAEKIWSTFFARDNRLTPYTVKISAGWPSRSAFGKNRKLIELFSHPSDLGGVAHFYLSPVVDNPGQAAVLLYVEALAAGLPKGTKRGKKLWNELAGSYGLEGAGKLWNPSPAVEERLNALAEECGPYPHEAIDKIAGERKAAASRMLKVECASGSHPEKYIIRASKQVLELGVPLCPLCAVALTPEVKEEGEEQPE